MKYYHIEENILFCKQRQTNKNTSHQITTMKQELIVHLFYLKKVLINIIFVQILNLIQYNQDKDCKEKF